MTSDRRPRIGINGGLEERGCWRVDLPTRYADAVRRAGGLPLGLYPTTDVAELHDVLGGLDGLLITGGDDFDTERLGLGPTHPAATVVPSLKQDGDLAMVREALSQSLPTLGICYGMQLLALAEGGRLYQHLPDDLPGGAPHWGDVSHSVEIEPASKLGATAGVPSLTVVSRHHQAVAEVAGPWTVVGRDPEGLIEAIEREGPCFALGLQWHPELGPPEGPDARLIAGFVAAAAARAASRGPDRSPQSGALTYR